MPKLTWHTHRDDDHDGPYYRFDVPDLVSGIVWYDGYTGWHWKTIIWTNDGINEHLGITRRMTESRLAAEESARTALAATGITIPQRRARRIGVWFA